MYDPAAGPRLGPVPSTGVRPDRTDPRPRRRVAPAGPAVPRPHGRPITLHRAPGTQSPPGDSCRAGRATSRSASAPARTSRLLEERLRRPSRRRAVGRRPEPRHDRRVSAEPARRPPEPPGATCSGGGRARARRFADGAFDRVFHVGGINGYRDRRRALAEMARVARPRHAHRRRRRGVRPHPTEHVRPLPGVPCPHRVRLRPDDRPSRSCRRARWTSG